MIRFKSLSYKNFLSIGNNGVEYDFHEGQTYLIMGKNGGGKSTIIDALNFALYGKPFRKINKPQLVNSINQKHCEVEVVFETRGREYHIVRTIKPNRLRMWEDGKEVPERANVHDFQNMITNQILRMSESSFRQLVVLGSKSYKPFMTLDASERRIVIEDLLDIGVYQSMYNILKKKSSAAEKDLELSDNKLLEIENSIETSQEYLNRISGEEGEDHLAKIKKNIDALYKEKKKEEKKLAKLLEDQIETQITDLQERVKKLKKEAGKLDSAHQTMKFQLKNHESEYEFFQDNDSCPKCHQDITEEFKENQVQQTKEQIEKLNSDLERCAELYQERVDKANHHSQELSDLNETLSDIRFLQNDIRNIEKSITTKEQEYAELKSKSEDDVSFIQNKINESIKRKGELEEHCEELKDQLRSYEHISGLLRDDGIKQQIIQTYLPLINKLVRKFLDIMEFNLDFRFDESFKETIKARGRDDFTYGNFSEGEKLRIDLCLLFTWRELSRMKNSAATNLLILDEIGESSLDEAGFDCFMKILKSERDTQCSVIISHRPDKIEPYVNRVYKYQKVGNFSDMKVEREEDLEKPVI